MPSFNDVVNKLNGVNASQGSSSRTPVNKNVSQDSINNLINDPSTQQIIQAANNSDDPDGFKYQAAVDMTTSLLGEQNTDDPLFKETLDKTFSSLEPSEGVTGESMRNENILTAIGNGIDDFNVGIGNGLDWLWDNGVGNLAGLFGGDSAKNTVQNFFDGRDLAIVPDIAEDILLSAIPGAGIPLAVGKNLLQQSDNIQEALTNRDSVTGRKLEDGQAAGKAGSALLTAGLAALPGIGKITKGAEAGLRALPGVGKAVQGAEKGLSKVPLIGGAIKGTDASTRIADAVAEAATRDAAKATSNAASKATGEPGIKRLAGNLTKAARDTAGGESSRLIGSTAGTAMGLGNMLMGEMGANGGDLADAAFNLSDDIANGNISLWGMLAPLGAGKLGRSMLPNLHGIPQQFTHGANMPFNIARASAAGNLVNEAGTNNTEQPSIETLVERINAAQSKGGDQ